MSKDELVGGLPDKARSSNRKRYALSRVVYYLKEADKHVDVAAAVLEGDELDRLRGLNVTNMLADATALYEGRPLDLGNAPSLDVKGKKAKARVAEEKEGE